MPTLRHVPSEARPGVQQALAQALARLSARKDLRSLWDVLALPKLLLRGTGDPRSHPSVSGAGVILKRLVSWDKGDYASLWKEVQQEVAVANLARASRVKGKGPAGPTAPKTPERTSALTIDKMRGLVAEGAPRKALNLLLSDGLHEASSDVLLKLAELYPDGNCVLTEGLPGSVDTGLPPLTDKEAWSAAVLKGVADFPRGSAPGPSGLRPSCLYDLLKAGPHVSSLLAALATLVAGMCSRGHAGGLSALPQSGHVDSP